MFSSQEAVESRAEQEEMKAKDGFHQTHGGKWEVAAREVEGKPEESNLGSNEEIDVEELLQCL